MFSKIITKVIFVLFIFLLFTAFVSGEYYQYTDENGKLSFTDDISKIPKDQRTVVKKFKSVTQEIKIVDTVLPPANSPITASSAISEKDEESIRQSKTAELKAIQDKLKEIRMSLENERIAVEAQAPIKGAAKKEQIEYSLKVEALNTKITEYEKKLNVFNNQVDELNASNKTRVMNKK